ncbi:RidA family protein [Xanthomonas nasturtii]|uniref:RidA family protein n=1 Tax=Xanthomonas nasturtii TaxID=1843581 RepID=UPI002B22E2E9|nr:RidA family protein [Xanthomonas nasturtii]MEA9577576.1 RidA family protein [Xanthomonas nasturtii]
MFRPAVNALVATVVLSAGLSPATAAEVIRHKIPNSDFPIAAAVEVPAGKATVYVSGKVPAVVDTSAPKDSAAAYGDTKAQTVSVLKQIQDQLKSLGLGMGDVVKMQVFLVGDPAMGGKMDFNGFMEGYRQFFGTKEQPNLPARSAFQIAALGNPLYRVEIEVVAVRP